MAQYGWRKINDDHYVTTISSAAAWRHDCHVERVGDVWHNRSEPEKYYSSFQDAMLASHPTYPVYGTEEWEKNPSPWQPGPIGRFFDSLLDDNIWILKWTGVILAAVAVNLVFRCFGR